MTKHVVLLGDSVFDNQAYTGGAPDVAGHLREILPAPWAVTLCAIDGSTTSDVGPQFDRIPAGATHAVLSLGGNDALVNVDLLELPVRSTAEALDLFRERLDDFDTSYGVVLDALIDLGFETTVCTIYEADLPPDQAPRANTALTMFNDVILRAAVRRSTNVIDLRFVCTERSDFSHVIEPSATGGRKVARTIAEAIGALNSAREPIRLFRGAK